MRPLRYVTALALAAVATAAHAVDAGSILSALSSSAGWTSKGTSDGVAVYSKTISGVAVPAYRGIKTVPVSCDSYFANVSDPRKHKAVSGMLSESGVISSSGSSVTFYQVFPEKMGFDERYWICQATNERNIGGVAGHHRQTWKIQPRTSHADKHAALAAKYGEMVYTDINYGFWDLTPAADGGCTVTYAVLTDPGGNIPESIGKMLTSGSLPTNINNFARAAGAQ